MRPVYDVSIYLVDLATGNNVHTGGGGGFTPGIVFNTGKQGVAYAWTDIGGLYRLNSDDTWTPLTDFANDTTWYAIKFRVESRE